jgi:hypothetical protein
VAGGDYYTSSKPAAAIGIVGGFAYASLFVRGTDYQIYQNNWVHPDFTNWSVLPEGWPTISEPAAVIFKDQPWLLARGTDSRIYQNKLDGAGWSEVPGN